MAEILTTLLNGIDFLINFRKYILSPVTNQFNYLCSYNGNIQSLSDEVERLNNRRSDLQLQVLEAERNTRTIASGATTWIKEAEKIAEKEKEIMEYKAQAQKGCFYGIFPNIKQRYSVSKEAKKTAEAARGLLQNEGVFNKIFYHTPLEPIPLELSSITQIDSRKFIEDEIMAALNDNNVYVIALCGMGGIGKTTMAEIIKNKVEEGKVFEKVVMVTVSQTLDLKNVQQGIAEGIGLLEMNEQTINARAQRLHMSLKKIKSILIILDDVWERLNLRKIGIPSKVTHQRCKIILTSRRNSICKSIEHSAKIIELNILSEQEAWNLFKEVAGEIVDEGELHPIAWDVARECKGLPLALETVAAALRDLSLPSWKDALHQLKVSNVTEIPEVHDRVYVPLKLSFDHLRNEEARYLFLLCCLFPEDSEIPLNFLVKYVFNLPIFANTSNLEEARNRVYRLVEMLIDRFLLIRVELSKIRDIKDEYYMKYRVKMHDVIRDMGISIASKVEHTLMAIHDPTLREWPKKDSNYGNYTCISLKSSTNLSLLENIHCPTLKLLYVDSPKVEVQEGSFDKMQDLRVLHTHRLKSLPSSLSWATNLRSLILMGSKFMHLPNEIGECVNLEILSLFFSDIETLPEEIGKLKNLKLLDLGRCLNLRKIPRGALSGLVQLEELYISYFHYWGNDTNANVDEVLSLKKLTTLQLRASISSIQTLFQENQNLNKLLRYHVIIGKDNLINWENLDRCVCMTSFNYFPSMDMVQVLFDNAQAIELVGTGTSHIANKLSRHGYKKVERLRLFLLDIEFLFDSNSWNLPNISYFPCLRTLTLDSNEVLKEICNRQPPNGSFSNLTSIKVESCNALRHLFSFSVAAMLTKLESLEIDGCKTIEVLFLERNGKDYVEKSTIILPRLTKIKLSQSSLGALFWTYEDIAIKLPELCEVEIENCSSLKSFRVIESCFVATDSQENSIQQQYLIDPKVVFTGLKKLELRYSSNNVIFDPRIPSNNLVNLESLRIYGCNGCVSLFSNSISRAMPNLKDLYIIHSNLLQDVIAKENEEQTRSEVVILFPQLKELRLSSLPRMIQFCHGNDNGIQLPSLEFLGISGCKLMETFCRNQSHLQSSQESDSNILVEDHSFFDEVTCFKLKELELHDLNVTKIFGPKIIFGNFSSLQTVQIVGGHMRSIFSLPMFKGLVNLQELNVMYCSKLEEVIPKEDKDHQFPQLKQVHLGHLPKIVEFCHIKSNLDLPSLERLTITECPNLISFCTIETKIHPEEKQSFFHQKVGNLLRLETLNITECKGFINMFPNITYVKNSISNLEILCITACEMLQEVIGKKEEEEEEQSNSRIITLFPKLKQLNLHRLPNIKTFCQLNSNIHLKKKSKKKNSNIDFPSLEELTIDNCKLMETFFGGPRNFLSSSEVLDSKPFFTEVTCRKLKRMEFSSVNGIEELFDRKVSVGNFSRLESLKISFCNRLKSIFSPTLFRSLVNLKVLEVNSCPEVKEIISKDEKEVEETTIPTTKGKEIIFPQLETLELYYLPKLVRFCHIKNDLEIPSLRRLELYYCHMLESFSIGPVHLPNSVRIYTPLSKEVFPEKFNLSISDKRGDE